MDAKNIYIATSRMKSKINWEKSSGNEWSFVGEGSDFKSSEVTDFIASYFSEDQLYLVIDRHHAYELAKTEASSKIQESLKNQNVTLCNKTFTRMIEFNRIGVAKHGASSS